MEFPQFFPIGHLAPRLVGMDPIMWDPFRYKLGGKLLNGRMEEFIETYGATDGGVYTTPRDLTSYAITKEVEAGRGSPAGGAYLSFTHVPEQQLRDAFGPVIDLLLENGIDLRERPVEVAPIAHYHMGGIRVDTDMASTLPGLFAAGEAVGGANGANRLSGNALTEAVVFGHRAGVSAADAARAADPAWSDAAARPILDLMAQVDARAQAGGTGKSAATGKLWQELKELMWANVGLQRTEASLEAALERIAEFKAALPTLELTPGTAFNTTIEDWFDLRSSVEIAEVVARAALNRNESRGAHQRLDHPETAASFEKNQLVRQADGGLETQWVPVRRYEAQQRSALEGAIR
jgi:succinate dehydrogenase/fumarate reductase flavoprotein subunit